MARIRFTGHLRRYFPSLSPLCLEGGTVAQVLELCEGHFPGLGAYLRDDQGALRKHVNIFVDGLQIVDRQSLTDALSPQSEVFVVQALSGG